MCGGYSLVKKSAFILLHSKATAPLRRYFAFTSNTGVCARWRTCVIVLP
jgi:hypothetical protein